MGIANFESCKLRQLWTGVHVAQVVQSIYASIAVLLHPCVRGFNAVKQADAVPLSGSSLHHRMRCCWHADASKTCAHPAVRPTNHQKFWLPSRLCLYHILIGIRVKCCKPYRAPCQRVLIRYIRQERPSFDWARTCMAIKRCAVGTAQTFRLHSGVSIWPPSSMRLTDMNSLLVQKDRRPSRDGLSDMPRRSPASSCTFALGGQES